MNATHTNPLLNNAVKMDNGMLMNILTELVNSKPTACIQLPDFRIDQLIKTAIKKIGPVNERKVLEPICATYCLCMYYALNTVYRRTHIFRVLSLLQNLQNESIIATTNFCHKKLAMPDLKVILQKNKEIDINYKLEVFNEALAIARLTCRDLYAMMKIIYRIGRRGAVSTLYSSEEKKKQLKYSESIQPYSIYFMSSFAYSHILIMLNTRQAINIYPGSLETVLSMILITTIEKSNHMKKKECNTLVSNSNTEDQLVQQIILEEEIKKQKNELEKKKENIIVTLKLNFDTFLEASHKLAVFVAHIVFDDRNLQETLISHTRWNRQLNHPDVIFAQFRASAVKALFSMDDLPSSTTRTNSSTAAATNGDAQQNKCHSTREADRSGRLGKALIAVAADSSTTPTAATASGFQCKSIIDIMAADYFFFKGSNRVEAWQLQDPAEADYSFQEEEYGEQTKATSTSNMLPVLHIRPRGGLSSAGGDRNKHSARNMNKKTPTDTNTTGTATSIAATDVASHATSIDRASPLPLLSDRPTARDTPGRRQRLGGKGAVPAAVASSTSAALISARSNVSNMSEGERSDSEIMSRADYSQSVSSMSTKGTAATLGGLFSNNPYAPAQGANKSSAVAKTKSSGEDIEISLEQKISGYWAMGKYFRPVFIVFDSLQTQPELHRYFPSDYHPVIFNIPPEEDVLHLQQPALGARPVYEACKILEAQYYHLAADTLRLPKILDPTQDAYWICHYLIEYLAKKTTQGFGFHPSTQSELAMLAKQFKTVKLHNHGQDEHTGTHKHCSPPKQPILSSFTPSKQSESILPIISMTISNNKTSKSPTRTTKEQRFQTIKERLAAAAMEAELESKVYNMKQKLSEETFNSLNINNDSKIPSPKTRTRFFSDFSDSELIQSGKQDTQEEEKNSDILKSVVWTCPPHLGKVQAITFIGQEDEDFNENPFREPISKKAKLEYARKILEYQKEKADEEAAFEQQQADQQENLMARNRLAKEERIRNLREQTKNELANKSKFKQEWEHMHKKQIQMEKTRARIEAKEHEESVLKEIMHVKEIKKIHENRLKQAELKKKEALQLEAAKIQLMASEQEVAIITRQLREEARMKYLEERRKISEDRIIQAQEKLKTKQKRKQQKAAETRDRIQARIRMGTFKYHNGIYGYYDNVRSAPVEWIQYEDATGTPYYYDPVTKTTQYRLPQDADYHHYTEDERREYDAIHGEGAYDLYKADIEFKDGVNRDGGYYNEKGDWVSVDGYYDENYEWVANEGYYDEDGIYRKYAKVCGDLSFMV